MIIIKIAVEEDFCLYCPHFLLSSGTVIPEWLCEPSSTGEHCLQVIDKIFQQRTCIKSSAIDVLNAITS